MSYIEIVRYCEEFLEKNGPATPAGVGWLKPEETDKRYGVMLDVIRMGPQWTGDMRQLILLDLGCGLSHFYDFIQRVGCVGTTYIGLDLSEKFIAASRSRYPENCYICADVLVDESALPAFDYAIMNGVFTVKIGLSFDEMFDYFKRLISIVYRKARKGIAFNVMSKQVDWERDELFHLPMDTLAWFLVKELGRTFQIRNDYGLYEYTVYLYK